MLPLLIDVLSFVSFWWRYRVCVHVYEVVIDDFITLVSRPGIIRLCALTCALEVSPETLIPIKCKFSLFLSLSLSPSPSLNLPLSVYWPLSLSLSFFLFLSLYRYMRWKLIIRNSYSVGRQHLFPRADITFAINQHCRIKDQSHDSEIVLPLP